jgi:tetratricopeptide (TPR) repeat protein
MLPDGTRNEFSGTAQNVVQARDIHGDVHIGAPATPPLPIPLQLPPDVAHFTGRGGDLARLDALLPEDGSAMPKAVVITAIDGTAGVGKTALAVHWAHRVAHRYTDGILYANLRGYDPSSPPVEPGEIIDEFLRDLGAPESQIRGSIETRAKLYRSRLQGRCVLVVLDNAATPDQVRPLLPGSPTCNVIVTSRSGLPGLIARDGARRITLGTLSLGKAIALLRRIVGSTSVDEELAQAAELARLCACLPLALCIAAERAIAHRHTRLADLVAELSDERARLDILSTDDDPTTAVRAVFSWSYNALTPEAARTFRLIGLHEGLDISAPAVAALTGESTEHTQSTLEKLTRVHLLDESARGRYQFHDLLRVYARERAERDESEEQRQAAVYRLLDWYLRTADAADRLLIPHHRHVPLDPPAAHSRQLGFANRDLAMEWCEAERANLTAATRHAAEAGVHIIAWKLPLALWSFFTLRKPWSDWMTTHQIGLTSARSTYDQYGEAWIINNLGVAYRQLGRRQDALEHYQQALTLWRTICDQWGEAHALTNLGETHQELGQYEQALELFQPALLLWRQLDDKWGEASTLTGLGNAHQALDRFQEAVDDAQQALDAFRAIDDQRGEGRALNQIAEAYQELGRHEEAIHYSKQAIAARRSFGERWGEARSLYTLGTALHAAGRLDEARESWEHALLILNELKAPLAAEVRARLESIPR